MVLDVLQVHKIDEICTSYCHMLVAGVVKHGLSESCMLFFFFILLLLFGESLIQKSEDI